MPTRQESREATRARVIDTAERLFEERGFRATTVRDIAAAAEVSVGTVMSVGDKDGLLVAIFDERITELHRSRVGETSSDGGEPTERVLGLLTPFLDLFAAHLELGRAYAAVLVGGRHDSVIFSALGPVLTEELELALTAVGGTPDAAPAAAHTIYLAYLGTLLAWAGSGEAGPEAALAQLRTAVAFAVKGVLA